MAIAPACGERGAIRILNCQRRRLLALSRHGGIAWQTPRFGENARGMGTAKISRCKRYRYELTRTWDAGVGTCAFICLNPSTADAGTDDPTVRRCIGFAKSWGYAGLVMLNAYAYRATDPAVMKAARNPIGPRNDKILAEWRDRADVVVAAWGTHCAPDRVEQIRLLIPDLHYLRLTKGGCPGHPLYLPRELRPRRWTG
jgi:hypothetical protein